MGASNRHLPRDKQASRLHALPMRWVLILFVILAAVMGGEARAVVVTGRAVVSERVGKAEMVEKRAEALRVESERASRVAFLEARKAAGFVDGGPLMCWFPGGVAVARSDALSGTGTTGCRRVSSTSWRYDLADNRVARTVDVQERLTDAAPWVRTLLSRQHCDYTKSTGVGRVADGRNQLGRSVESTYCWKINDGSLWKASEQTVDYAYDANGNRTSRVVHHWTQKRSGQYADGPWELGGWERTLDVMSWDVENRLVAMWRGPWLAQGSSSTVEELVERNTLVGTVWRWGYDHRTRRVWRNEPGPEGQNRVTSVVAFSGGTSVAEFSGGTLSLLLARGVDIGGGTRGLLWTARRETGSAETGNTVTLRFNRYNSRGDVVGQSDAAGVTTWAATYQADGRRTGEIGTNLNPKHATGRVRELGVNRDRHRANSKEEDPTGLLNEGFRYRDMETGTFISRDPLGHVDGPNVYCYVGQNPWSAVDPHGLARRIDPDGYIWKSGGHHVVPASVARDAGWHPDAKKIFDGGIKGSIIPTPKGHGFNKHGIYNNEVAAEMAQFLNDRGAELASMSAKDQVALAEEFVSHIKSVENPYISGFNSAVGGGRSSIGKWWNNSGKSIVVKSTGMQAARAGASIVNGFAKVTVNVAGKVVRVLRVPMIGGAIAAATSAAQGNSIEDIGRDALMAASGGDLAKDAIEMAVEPMGRIYNYNLNQIPQTEIDTNEDWNGDGIIGPNLLSSPEAVDAINDELTEEELQDE